MMADKGRNDKCSILVMGRNASLDLAYITSFFLNVFWKDCSYELVLCTQTKEPKNNLYDRIVYTDEEKIWGDRLQIALENINTKYVILLAEDFFLQRPVENKEIEECINLCESENGGGCRLNPPVPFSKKYNDKFDILPIDSIYRICLQPTLFRTEYLKKYAGLHLSPWQFERVGSLLSRNFDEKLFITRKSVYDCIHAWSHGMWDKRAYRLMKQYDMDEALYVGKKIYPWYMTLKDNVYICVISLAPTAITKIRIMQCKKNEKKLKG